MYSNKFKKKLKEGKEICTVAHIEADWSVAEIAGKLGFDAVLLDCEHTAASQAQALEFIRACECGGAVPFIRTRENSPELILRYLDAGALGILIPNVKSAEDARNAVKAIKYAPQGERGLSTTRASDYGYRASTAEYVKMANEETVVMLMIETPEAVENIEEILSVEGVDSIELGTTDLSNSMGYPGDRNHPDVVAAVDRVVAAARKMGKPVGSILRPGQVPAEELAKGFGVMTLCIPVVICDGMEAFMEQVKA